MHQGNAYAFAMFILITALSLAFFQPAKPATPTTTQPSTAPATPATTAPSQASSGEAHVTITVDAADAPDLESWGKESAALCQEWYPKIAKELASDGFTPRDAVKIVFRKKMRVPAATGGDTISVNAAYVTDHKDDRGMMIHELTHVIQAYPRQKEGLGWLTEGIADYIRFWVYEPQTRQRPIDKEHASYRNSYRITAAFLGWLVKTHDAQVVTKLNAKLRAGNADAKIFDQLLGKSVDDLWKEFIDAGAPSAPASPAPASPAQTPKPTPASPATPR